MKFSIFNKFVYIITIYIRANNRFLNATIYYCYQINTNITIDITKNKHLDFALSRVLIGFLFIHEDSSKYINMS